MNKQSRPNNKLNLLEVVSIAVGTMIGASIFSIFGTGASIAGKYLPVAFLLSGSYALIVAFSYAKLGKRIVSNAGPIAFIIKGIGDNIITGAMSLLIWLTYVISIAMFAKGFAGYFLPMVDLPVTTYNMGMVEILLILFFTSLNLFGSKAVGKSELYIVLVKVLILLIFIVSGLLMMDTQSLALPAEPGALKGGLYASVVFFLSYMGFGLIVNASENMKQPEKNVPRAIYLSIGIVMLIYIGVSLAAIGNLPVSKIIEAKENALAEAAKPFLGNFGFLLISIGALFSISSALNATIYGGANIAYSLAKEGELPDFFERKLWFNATEGLYITSAISILLVLVFNIGEIASITSSMFTIIYLLVVFSHFKLRKKVGGNKWMIIFNLSVLILIFAVLILYQYKNQIHALYGTLIALSGAFVLEFFYRKYKPRKFKKSHYSISDEKKDK